MHSSHGVMIASCLFKALCSLGIVLQALEAVEFGTCMKDAKRENKPLSIEESDFAPFASAQVSNSRRSTVPFMDQNHNGNRNSEVGLHLGVASFGRQKRAEIED